MLDEQMGAVLQALDGSNLADNTLVVCTTDHGIAFPGMKCDLTDHGIGVFLILRGPGGFTGGTVCDAMVTHMDIFPTVCDLLGIDPPAWLQGSSIVPLISGEADRIHDEIFAEINYHSYYDPQRAIRTPRWKYIRHYHDGERPGELNCDPGLCKDFWLEYGWRDRPIEQERLYDLVFDPGETHNVARDPFATPVLDNMRRRMDRWMEDTDDPLLLGKVQAPRGARIDDPSDLPAVDPWRTGA
jgi:arylsulfatase A-like enzyme